MKYTFLGVASVVAALLAPVAHSADFVAVRVEAENYTSKNDAWMITSPGDIPDITPDPDGPHNESASGDANVELLPDTRVTHEDPILQGQNYWNQPGTGPRLDYTFHIPEAGRYYVFVKAYSSGTEDNGIHVGLNNTTPESGARIQLCSGKNNWTWSSAQRTDENHCGVTKTIWLDFTEPGTNTVSFYAREDGFELDQFLLLKENNPTERNCFPLATNDKVRCTEVSTGNTVADTIVAVTLTDDGHLIDPNQVEETIDVDLDINLSTNISALRVGDQFDYQMEVQNKDSNDSATSVVATVALPSGLQYISSGSCSEDNATVSCNFPEVTANGKVSTSFTAEVTAAGTQRADAQVSAHQTESNSANNSESHTVTTSAALPAIEGALAVVLGSNTAGLADTVSYLITIENNGEQDFSGATVDIQPNSIASLVSVPGVNCTGTAVLSCDVDPIGFGETTSIPLFYTPVSDGFAELEITLNVSGDVDTGNNKSNVRTLIKPQFVASAENEDIAIEAENFTSQLTNSVTPLADNYNPAWHINSNNLTASVTPDMDQSPPADASTAAYMEFLPDTRLGDSDSVVDGISNYAVGGDSAVLTYRFFANDSGRYYVNARIRANNSQDASIHIGLNDYWPATANSISVCNPNGSWQWSNNIRTGELCDLQAAAYLDISTPGIQTLQLSAATDGVEVDKLVLRKVTELATGTGANEAAFIPAATDLAATSTATATRYTLDISNLDSENTAVDIAVAFDGLAPALAGSIDGLQSCTAQGSTIVCTLDSLAAGSTHSASVNFPAAANADAEINRLITSTVTIANDNNIENNSSVASFSTKTGGGVFAPTIGLLLLIRLFFRRRTYECCA